MPRQGLTGPLRWGGNESLYDYGALTYRTGNWSTVPLQLLRATHHELDLSEVGVFKCVDELGPQIAGCPGVRGVMVLATCNRFEVYLDADTRALGALQAHRGPLELLRGESAARHLFAVTAGLESVVVGEPEIAGQVRRALNHAESSGCATPVLQRVFSDALATRRTVRERTGLGSARPSLIRLALDLASHRITDWAGARVLLVGTGRYATSCLEALRDRGVTTISVWSPSGRGE